MSSAAVEFDGVHVDYGSFKAVRDFSLSIEKGQFVTLLGPSGCGKTTVLRAIAGLINISAGRIAIGGSRIDQTPIYKRNIGLVFQNYALFPHKTVFDNIAFGLKYRNVPKAEISRKVGKALEMVRLPGSEKKLPSQLSGGQQQRIALARAIVFEPEVLLLDEPLSALDANMREEMRGEIKKIQRETGITAIFVTHDQEEALAMSDRVVVMSSGRMEQIGTPVEVFESPGSRFVADFIGKANIVRGKVARIADGRATIALSADDSLAVPEITSLPDGSEIDLVIRPQRLSVSRIGSADLPNRFNGTIIASSYLGGTAAYEIKLDWGTMRAVVSLDGPILKEGERVTVGLQPESTILLDADTGRRIS